MDLTKARKEIDVIDNEIKALFIKRMGVSEEIARIKAKSGSTVYNPEREAEVVKRLSSDVDEKYRDGYINIVKQIMLTSREYQNEIINGK